MNEDEIKIGIIGNIVEGDSCGWFLLIKEEFEDFGGYLILVSKDPNITKYAERYDYWAEDKSTLIDMFKDFKWKSDSL
jgi:hypothetical protein